MNPNEIKTEHVANRQIRVFISSTFSDMKGERDILQDKVFPRLQQHCLANGLRFQVIDLRWGVPEEAGKDNRTMRICQRELKRCQEGSIKPNFLVLLGDRYGWRPLPEVIPADVFEELERELTARNTESAKKLETWYRRDDNAVPSEYVLQPRTGRFEEFAVWQREVELPLLAAMIESAEALLSSSALSAPLREKLLSTGIGLSATHQEILHGALDLAPAEVRRHVHTFSRTFTGASSPPHRDFADFLPDGSPDNRSRDRLEILKSGLKEHLGGESNFHDYSLAWKGDGGFPAADLEPFAGAVFDCIKKVIDAQVAALNEVSREEQEEQAHHAFCEERRNGFIGRDEPLAAIEAYLRAGSSHPLAIIGPAGSGKSALLAEAVHRARGNSDSEIRDPKSGIISRFIGVTPGSSDLIELLRELVARIRACYPRQVKQGGTGVPPVAAEPSRDSKGKEPDDRDIPSEINPLTNAFLEALGRATAERPLWIFLDALDQFRDANLASSLSWLPQKLPEHVRIVVSAALPVEGEASPSRAEGFGSPTPDARHRLAALSRNLTRMAPGPQTVQLGPLTPADGTVLLDRWLKDAGRTLDVTQRRPILDAFAVEGNALWLRVASEEAARWPRWHTPDPTPPGLHDLLATVLERLSRNEEHGEIFVKRALGYLACARHGLAEDEIIGVLGVDTTVMGDLIARSPTERAKPEADRIKALPVAIWVRFHGDIAFYLSERQNQGAAMFGFYHRSFGEAVERFCLQTDADRRPLHETMAQWFGKQPWFLPPAGKDGQPPGAPERSDPANTRKASELPFHLQRIAELTQDTDCWDPLVEVLCDLDCVETKARSGLIYELVGDYNNVLATLREFRDENERLAKRDAAMIAYNKALRDYAVVRCDWWFANECGETRPEPPYPAMPPELHDASTTAIPEESFPRAARLRHFSNFVSGHIAVLTEYHEDTLPIAYNWAADGPVAAEAESKIILRTEPWLRRSPRPFMPPFRPQCLRKLHSGFDVSCVSISPDGRRAVSSFVLACLQLWDLETGACLRTFEKYGHWSVSINPDGRCAVSGSHYKLLEIWDIETGACLLTLKGHSDSVLSVSVSPDGRRAVSGSGDKTVRVWDLKTGACLRTLEGHRAMVWSVSVSPDGRRAVSGSRDKTVRVWDLETGACLRTLEGHSDGVNSLSVSPDGRRAVSGSSDKTLRVWDLETGVCMQTLQGHASGVTSVSVSPDGLYAVSGSHDRTIRLWDLSSSQSLRTLEGHVQTVRSIRMSPDGRHALSGGDDGDLRLWDLRSDSRLRNHDGHSDAITSVSLSPDGQCAVSSSSDHTLRVWNPETGQCLRTLKGHSGSVWSASVISDGRRAVSGSCDATLRLWDLQVGLSLRILQGHDRGVLSVSASPDGRHVVSGSMDNTIKFWDMVSGHCLRTLKGMGVSYPSPFSGTVNSVSISPDGRRAIAGSNDTEIWLWDLRSGHCHRTLEGHRDWVTCVSFSPDGRRAISGSRDTTIRVWDTEIGELGGSGDSDCGTSFNPVAKRLIIETGSAESAFQRDAGIDAMGHSDSSKTLSDCTLMEYLMGSFRASAKRADRIRELKARDCLCTLKGHSACILSVSFSPDGLRAVSTSIDSTLRVWDIGTGDCLAIYCASTVVLTAADSPGGKHILCGTEDGQMHFLTPVNFPTMGLPAGPAVLTAIQRAKCGWFGRTVRCHHTHCPSCAIEFAPPREVLTAIRQHTATLRPDQSACLDLPDAAFEDPHLLANCPHCGRALKFNPFVVDYETMRNEK